MIEVLARRNAAAPVKGTTLKKVSKFCAVLLLLAPLALAQQSRIYNENGKWAREVIGTLSGAKNLRIKVDAGSVKVEGGPQQGISYAFHSRISGSEESARRDLESYKLSAYVRGDTAFIVAEWQGGRPRRFSADFAITVPRSIEAVRMETEGGNIVTRAIGGMVDAQSGGGSISVDEIGGVVRAETGGGNIDAGSMGGDVTLRTGGGSIRIASAKGKIVAESGGGSVVVVSGLQGAVLETGGGNIEVEKCNGELRASTGGGSIEMGDIGGPATLETGGGSIRVTSAKGVVHAETGGGSIELNGVPSARAETGAGGIIARFVSSGDRADSILETSVGDITVYLAPELAVSIRASIEAANGHKISTDFADIKVTTEGGQWGPQTITADGSLNGGGPMLKIRTTTGDIRIRRGSH